MEQVTRVEEFAPRRRKVTGLLNVAGGFAFTMMMLLVGLCVVNALRPALWVAFVTVAICAFTWMVGKFCGFNSLGDEP